MDHDEHQGSYTIFQRLNELLDQGDILAPLH